MRISVALLPILLGACVSAPSSAPLRKAYSSVFRIDGPRSSGSAFVVRVDDRGVLLATAWHVVGFPGAYRVRGLGPCRTYWSNMLIDLAFVLVEKPESKVAAIELGPTPRVGDRLFTVGFGGMKYGKWISEGLYSGRNRVSAPVWYGTSGGAVLDDRGRAVGVLIRVGWYNSMPYTPWPVANPTQGFFVALTKLPR